MNSEIKADVSVTLDDQVQFNEFMLDQPVMRRRRMVRWGLVVVLSPLLGLTLGVLTGWATSKDPIESLPNIIAAAGVWDFFQPCIVVSGLLLAIALLLRLFRPYLLRRAVRKLLKEREGIDPADPQLRERVHCTVSDEGFSSEGVATRTMIAWSQIRNIEETRDLLVVRTGTLSGFLLPKRDLTVDQIAAIKALASAYSRSGMTLAAPLSPGRLGN